MPHNTPTRKYDGCHRTAIRKALEEALGPERKPRPDLPSLPVVYQGMLVRVWDNNAWQSQFARCLTPEGALQTIDGRIFGIWRHHPDEIWKPNPGKCPVPGSEPVDVVYADGVLFQGTAHMFTWSLEDETYPIVLWRPGAPRFFQLSYPDPKSAEGPVATLLANIRKL